MKTKTYKIKKYWYDKVTEDTITIPENMDIIVKNGDIGDGLFDGAEHYCGVMLNDNYTDYEELFSDFKYGCVYYLSDIVFVEFNNIIEIDKLPIISNEEFKTKYKIDSYYIVIKNKPNIDIDKAFIKDENGCTIINNDYLKELSNQDVEPFKIIKINDIFGPYSVNVLELIMDNNSSFYLLTNKISLFNLLYNDDDKYDKIILNGHVGNAIFKSHITKYLEQYVY
jgi:hypothetical protein